MATLDIRLSGEQGGTETVEGYEVNGLFIHHPVSGNDYVRKMWTVTHSQSGQSLLTQFDKLKSAKSFALDAAQVYDMHVSADDLLAQFKARGTKPSISDLAVKYGSYVG